MLKKLDVVHDVVPFVEKDRQELVNVLAEKIRAMYEDRPESVALIPKRDRSGSVVDYTPEMTRPMALILWQFIVSLVQSSGGSLKEDIELMKADEKGVIIKACVEIRFGERAFVFCELGEAYTEEEDRDETPARRAYTRAFKRLIEKLVGEDFINRVLLELTGLKEKRQEVRERAMMERKASERQIEILKDFWRKKKITEEHIRELIQEGVLSEDFDLEKALEEGELSELQASKLLEKGGLKRRKA